MQVADVFQDIHAAILADELELPSLPDIALRIHATANDPGCNFDTIGRVLKRDAAMSAALIRLANSPLYRSRVKATNVRSSVHRIGIPGVRNFVTTMALKNLFASSDRRLTRVFRATWSRSCEISAQTAVLATFCAGFDPDDALLAGLLQDIGAVTLLGALSRHPGEPPDEAGLQAGIEEWTPRLGALLLTHWGFDQRYVDVVSSRHHWDHDPHPEASLADVVNVARLNHYIDSGYAARFPALDAIPAYAKLPAQQLTARGTLRLLEDAADDISMVRAMLRD